MDNLFWGVLGGFFIGSFTYGIIHFVVSPHFKYKKIREEVLYNLKFVEALMKKEKMSDKDIENLELLHEHGRILTVYVENKMPLWFRLSLERKNIFLSDLALELMNIARIRQTAHLEKRLKKAKEFLGLSL